MKKGSKRRERKAVAGNKREPVSFDEVLIEELKRAEKRGPYLHEYFAPEPTRCPNTGELFGE